MDGQTIEGGQLDGQVDERQQMIEYDEQIDDNYLLQGLDITQLDSRLSRLYEDFFSASDVGP